MKFAVVHFPETNEVEVVPILWLEQEKEKIKCWWPPFKTSSKIKAAVQKQLPIEMETWLIYHARILGRYGN